MGRMIGPPGIDEQFELRLEAANEHTGEAAWEHALKEIEAAQSLVNRPDFPASLSNAAKLRLLIQRGTLERRLGNYELATKLLTEAAQQYGDNDCDNKHLETLGELGLALLRQGAFAQAGDKFLQQYTLATSAAHMFKGRRRALKALSYACHAVGNRALAIFHITVPDLDNHEGIDKAQLSLAMELLTERLERATVIRSTLHEDQKHSGLWNMVMTWHAEALDYLVLCCLALRDTAKALDYGCKSVALSKEQPESTVRGLSRYYYGLALYYGDQKSDAFELWRQTEDTVGCTAAIALARESSTENAKHLRLLAQHGVGFLRHDEYGYSVLDYTVLSNNESMKAVAIDGMRQELCQYEKNGQYLDAATRVSRIERSVVEAQRRKKYRETYQLTFRPILSELTKDRGVVSLSYQPVSRWTLARHWLRSNIFFPLGRSDEEIYLFRHARRQTGIDKLRKGYLRQREMSEDTRTTFDRLVLLRYLDFKNKMIRLPRPHDKDDMQGIAHLRQGYTPVSADAEGEHLPFVIFLSYRWLGKGSPDDEQHTQYRRMLESLTTYLKMHPWLNEKNISVWLDVACIDQVDPAIKQRGINALPLVVAQCNALISIVDSEYLSRAWCSVEVMMIQTLRSSYGLHEHWNYDTVNGRFFEAEDVPPISDELEGLRLSYPEVDEPTVKFLVRQSRVLAKS